MGCAGSSYLGQNSKHASSEQKYETLKVIQESGNNGIRSADVRARTGLPDKDHRTVMYHLSQYGYIHIVGVAYNHGEAYNKWGCY